MRHSDQNLNRLTILKAIRRGKPVSRADLPAITGLSAGTITNVTSDLLERGLIVETREDGKRSGRPRRFIEINAPAAIAVGASVRGTGVLNTVLVDLLGNPLFSMDASYVGPRSFEEYAVQVAAKLKAAIAASTFKQSDISHVGIALPAVVNSKRGVIHFMTTFEPGAVPFARIVEERLGLPVTIENEVVTMARTAHWFGAAQEFSTFSFLHVGYWIGSAEYEDGLPKYGANGINAEFGHMKVDFGPDALPCLCGAKGCVGAYGSMYGLLQQSGDLADAPFPPVESIDARFDRFMDRAENGDARACRLLDQAVVQIGRALANQINVTNPANILISVLNERFLRRIESRLMKVLRDNVMRGMLGCTNMKFALTNQNWRWSGTAALALEQTYLGELPPEVAKAVNRQDRASAH